MITLEGQKSTPPRFSRSIQQLVKFLDIEIDAEQLSAHAANIHRLLSKDAGTEGSPHGEMSTIQQMPVPILSLDQANSRYESGERKLSARSGNRRRSRNAKKRANKSMPTATLIELLPREKMITTE